MAQMTWFNFEASVNDDFIEEKLRKLVEDGELELDEGDTADLLSKRLRNLVVEGAEITDGVPAFQAWFYDNLPEAWDMMVGILNEAVDAYISENIFGTNVFDAD
jgi:hypothetical protein